MKLNKEAQKALEKEIKEEAKKFKIKKRSYALYKREKDFYLICYVFIHSTKLGYTILVKDYNYDNILWDMIDMEDNKNCSDSLRAIGAFSAPHIILEDEYIEYTEESYRDIPQFVVKRFIDVTNKFMEQYKSVDEYVLKFEEKSKYPSYLLICLALINSNRIEEAVEIAKENIKNNNEGPLYNAGKGNFAWLLEKYDKK